MSSKKICCIARLRGPCAVAVSKLAQDPWHAGIAGCKTQFRYRTVVRLRQLREHSTSRSAEETQVADPSLSSRTTGRKPRPNTGVSASPLHLIPQRETV